jgi:thiamine monophosphate kinase
MRYVGGPQPLACDSLQRRHDLVVLTGRLGDIGAGRELLRRERAALRQAASNAARQ